MASYKNGNKYTFRLAANAKQRTRVNGKRIQCVETGTVYDTIKDASKDLGINKTNISLCAKELIGPVGKLSFKFV